MTFVTFYYNFNTNNKPSTLGVDAVPHKNCADEPLFSMIPIPFELLYFVAIGRQESAKKIEVEKVETEREVELPPSSAIETGAEEKPDEFVESLDEWPKNVGAKRVETDGEAGVPPSAEKSDKLTESEEPVESQSQALPSPPRHLKRSISSRLQSDPDGKRASYLELQRSQLSSRTHIDTSVQRPGNDNPRIRSSLFRSR